MHTKVFRDFNAFEENVGDVDCTMMLQNAERHVWSVTHLNLPGVHIQNGLLGSGNIIEGQSLSQGFLLYLPLSKGCEYLGNGASFGRGTAWLMEPNAEFYLSTKTPHDWCSLLIPGRTLPIENGGSEPSTSFERPPCRVLAPGREPLHLLEALVRDTVVAATQCSTFETSYAGKRAAAAATRLVRSIVGEPRAKEHRQRGRPRATRWDVIRSCRELLEDHRGKPLLVSDLAAGAGVSERTLRTAFNAYFGVGPGRYLQLSRLREVHQALLAAEADETSVTEVLMRHGEWEFGRFAVRYRRLFGERPSETLAQKSRGRVAAPIS